MNDRRDTRGRAALLWTLALLALGAFALGLALRAGARRPSAAEPAVPAPLAPREAAVGELDRAQRELDRSERERAAEDRNAPAAGGQGRAPEPAPSALPAPSVLVVRIDRARAAARAPVFVCLARIGSRGALRRELQSAVPGAGGALAEVEFAELERGPWRVWAEGRGALSPAQVVQIDPERRATVELALEDAELVRGRVLAADGTPAAGVRLRLTPAPALLGAAQPLETDASGSFELRGLFPAQAGPWTLELFGDAGSVLLAPRALSHLGAAVPLEDVRLPALEMLEVEVRDAHGLAVPDAAVEIAAAPTLSLESGTGSGLGGGRGRTTDAAGRVRFAWLVPGELRVLARASDGRRAQLSTRVPRSDAGALVVRLPEQP